MTWTVSVSVAAERRRQRPRLRTACAAGGRCAAIAGAYALCLTFGCVHGAPAPQPSAQARAQQRTRADIGPRQAAPAVPQPEPDTSPPTDDETADWEPVPPRIEDYMADHFVIATWSRDAVINGVLEALSEPLQAVADFDYSHVTPKRWMPRVLRMQAAARVTASAESLTVAAAGVAAMAQQCGDCHAEERQRLYFGPDIEAPKSPPPDSFGERMQRHIWAADRMWEGLTGPSNEAWNAGAFALARAPEQSPASEPPLPADLVAQLTALRELGKSALEAKRSDERAKVYGLVLASCADCHSRDYRFVF